MDAALPYFDLAGLAARIDRSSPPVILACEDIWPLRDAGFSCSSPGAIPFGDGRTGRGQDKRQAKSQIQGRARWTVHDIETLTAPFNAARGLKP